MLSNFGRFLIPIFIIAIIFTLADAFVSFYNLKTLEDNHQEVMHSEEFSLRLQMTFSNLQDMETGQRGYILTGDKAFLDPYVQASKQLPQNLSKLYDYSKNDQQRKNEIAILEKVIKERNSILNNAVTEYNNGQPIENMVSTLNDGKNVMDEARAIIDQIEKGEEKRLDARMQEEQASVDRIYATLGISSLFSLFLIIIAYYLIRREFAIRRDLENRKDEFISLASHELKTPLTSMKLFNEIVQKQTRKYKDKNLTRYTAKIDEQVIRLSELVKDLLDLSRIQTGKLELKGAFFNIDQLIEDIIDGLQGTTKKHTFVFKKKLKQRIYGDRYRIYQVLTNLLTNAIKYSPQGGNIVIEVQKKGKEAITSVKDSGIGIEQEHIERIFERLYRVRTEDTASASGLGIGLFISSDIVRRHGGRMWAESEKGKGSTLYFSLPISRRKLS